MNMLWLFLPCHNKTDDMILIISSEDFTRLRCRDSKQLYFHPQGISNEITIIEEVILLCFEVLNQNVFNVVVSSCVSIINTY